MKLGRLAGVVGAALFLLACEGAAQTPEAEGWCLVFYRGSNGGVICPKGIEGLECAFKNQGTIESPIVTKAYTRDQFALPLAACLEEGKLVKHNPFSPEATRLFGLNAVAPDRRSFNNKPPGYWDMVMCVKGSRDSLFKLLIRDGLGWISRVSDYRYVE